METKMQSTDQPDKTADDLDAQRAILTKSIDDVAGEIGIAVSMPIYISPFISAFEQAVTPWQRLPHHSIRPTATGKHAMAIVCEVIGRRVGAEKLHSRELIYAVANAPTISAGELVPAPSDLSQ